MVATATRKPKKKGPTHHPLIAPDDGHVISQSYVLSDDSCCLIEATSTLSVPTAPILPQAADTPTVPNDDVIIDNSTPLADEDENVEVPPRQAKRYANLTLNLQGKLSAYDFYCTLELQTNGSGLLKLPDRMLSFFLMVREFRHVRMAKRVGRGHDPEGLVGMPMGGLSTPCRACPHPDINLPPGWDTVSKETSWKYRLFIQKDCNFHLKNCLRSSEDKDPTLSNSLAYYVDNVGYSTHILNHVDEEDVKGCTGFAALLNATTKRTQGLRATGVVGVSCHHDCWQANGFGDLQLGERYCNVDYVFFSSLRGVHPNLGLVDSYNILSIPHDNITFLVNKFHLAGHGKKCQAPFSFNFKHGVGRSNGKGLERLWAWLNGAGPSTKEMGLGACRDTVNDFCGFMNWMKTIGLAKLFHRLLLEAIGEAIQHGAAFRAFNENLQRESLLEVAAWDKMLTAWEADNKPCPYESSEESMTLNEVRKMLMAEEGNGGDNAEQDIPVDRLSTPLALLILGMDIKKSQHVASPFVWISVSNLDNRCILQKEVQTTSNPTTLQAAELRDRQNILKQKIERFHGLQAIHMPSIVAIRNVHSSGQSEQLSLPENLKLYLPFKLSSNLRGQVCLPGLVDLEARLQFAEATDALCTLRHHLHMQTHTNWFKIKNVTSQVANTRFQTILRRVEGKVDSAVRQYNHTHGSYLSLKGHGSWENTLQVLNPGDVHGPNEKDIQDTEVLDAERLADWTGVQTGAGTGGRVKAHRTGGGTVEVGEGCCELSWLWTQVEADESSNDPKMCKVLQIEWVKAKARAAWWHKEVILLDEEMHQSIKYCNWKAHWRMGQKARHQDLSLELYEGLCASTSKQAFFEHHRALAWEIVWKTAREWANTATTTLSSSDLLDEVDLGPNTDVSLLGDDFDDDNGLYVDDN
ncbi:hypothetical protein JAAARDRAFT_197930 [Jaapia argillacea MUCL 33604]|uniref:CxC2-like cysteine cluster KDZ transposase-associated domain-containing protein n=1 Tax=Jaapia argillacea MUCL 33604 TaxID=933084 RepID=A0A067PNI7_9AGAM|nr:hypothetical protein JAAARDRAFT_197930 [Jaapia argillacea MUCL 33604]